MIVTTDSFVHKSCQFINIENLEFETNFRCRSKPRNKGEGGWLSDSQNLLAYSLFLRISPAVLGFGLKLGGGGEGGRVIFHPSPLAGSASEFEVSIHDTCIHVQVM